MKTETIVTERTEVTNGGPFASYLSGSESFETPEEWSGGEVWQDPTNGEQSLEWRAELPTPGYDWSEKTLLTNSRRRPHPHGVQSFQCSIGSTNE